MRIRRNQNLSKFNINREMETTKLGESFYTHFECLEPVQNEFRLFIYLS